MFKRTSSGEQVVSVTKSFQPRFQGFFSPRGRKGGWERGWRFLIIKLLLFKLNLRYFEKKTQKKTHERKKV